MVIVGTVIFITTVTIGPFIAIALVEKFGRRHRYRRRNRRHRRRHF